MCPCRASSAPAVIALLHRRILDALHELIGGYGAANQIVVPGFRTRAIVERQLFDDEEHYVRVSWAL
jgi:hypothetical protein